MDPSHGAKRSERRSSILKPISVPVDREPLQEIGNSPSGEPTLTYTTTTSNLDKVNGKNNRRNSIGRRVSFSRAIQQVKEFRTDERNFTIWNSTYEKEDSQIHSDSSCSTQKSGEGEVFAEKSFIAAPDEDMEMTCAIQRAPSSSSTKTQSASAANMTIFGNDDMEMTITQSVLRKKFGSKLKSDENDGTDKSFVAEMTDVIPKSSIHQPINATNFGNDDMEMTTSNSFLAEKFGSKNQAKKSFVTLNKPEDDMEIPKKNITSTVQTNIDTKDEEMEMTGTQSLPLIEGKITPPHQIIDKTLKVPEDDMQMTCRIVTDAIPKSSINQPIDATNFGNDDMEMTTSHSVLAQKFGSKNQAQNTAKKSFVTLNNPEDDMEIPKEKISSIVQTNIDAKDEGMEMTGTQSLPLVEGKITPPNQNIDKTLKVPEDDMQMTCRILTDAIPKSSNHQPINATSFGNDDMEMTTSNNFLAKKFGSKNQANQSCATLDKPESDMKIPKENISSKVQTNIDAKDEEMEMTGTQYLPLVEGKITPPNQSIDRTLKVPEDDMQMTCRIVTDAIPKSSIHQPINATSFGNDDMEMTASNSFLAEKFGSKNQAQITAKTSFVALNKPEIDMEIPRENISFKVQTNIDTNKEKAEMTLPLIEEKIAHPHQSIEKMSKVPEDDMEMTCRIQKEKISPKIQPNIEKDNEEMEMTGAIPMTFPITKEKINSKIQTNIDTNNEEIKMTVEDKITHPHQSIEKMSKAPEDDMEMTCRIQKEKISPKVQPNIEQDIEEMEMTGTQSLPLAKFIKNKEFFIPQSLPVEKLVEDEIPLADKDIDKNQDSKSFDASKDMEMTHPVLEKNFGSKTNIESTKDDDMEMTGTHSLPKEKLAEEKIPLVNKDIENKTYIEPQDYSHDELNTEVDQKAHEVINFEKSVDAVPQDDVQMTYDSPKSLPPNNEQQPEIRVSELQNKISLTHEDIDKTYEEPPQELSREELNTEFDKKINDRRACIDKLKRFLADLDTPEEMVADGQPPIKRVKSTNDEMTDSLPGPVSLSVFKNLVKNQPERSHHGEWQLEREATDSAIFSFFLGTLKLKFILGHSITSKKEKNIKHWAIRKVSMEVNRHKDADAEVKLVDYLLLKEWPQNKLAQVFRTTEYLEKGLEAVGESVNKAFKMILDMDDIKSKHCVFKIVDEHQVYVEFFSVRLLMNFAIEVNYRDGFKPAKTQGVKLIPLIDQYGATIRQESLDTLVKASPSGWSFFKSLVELVDAFVQEIEIQKKMKSK